jgi:hypothetical protein
MGTHKATIGTRIKYLSKPLNKNGYFAQQNTAKEKEKIINKVDNNARRTILDSFILKRKTKEKIYDKETKII